MTKEEMEAMLKAVGENVSATIEKQNAGIGDAIAKAVDAKFNEANKDVAKKDIHGGSGGSVEVVKEERPDFISNKGKFFQAVHKASTDMGMKTRLATALEADWKEKAKLPEWKEKAPTGMNSVVSVDGGFLPTAEIMTEIKESAYETGLLIKDCTMIPLGGTNNSLEWREVVNENRSTAGAYAGIQAYRVAEGASSSYSAPKYRERELRVKDMQATIACTNQLLSDATSLGSWIGNTVPKAFNDLIDEEIIRGTGAGECLGILNSGGLLSVAKETSQAADSIIYDNVVKMFINFDPAKVIGATWLINPHAQSELWKMSMPIGTGGSAVFMPPSGISEKPYSTLLGLPVRPVHTMSKLGDKGDIMLVNMKDYLLVDKGGIEGAESMHVLFLTNENVFRFTWRINGMPFPTTTITPKHGNTNDKLASFVTLDERA